MSKKKALGTDPLSWIKPTAAPEGQPAKGEKAAKAISTSGRGVESASMSVSRETDIRTSSKVPKYETYEVKLTVRLSEEQLNFLSKLERQIMKSRSPRNRVERITKNSVIRATINALEGLEIDTREIRDEEELGRRIIWGVRKTAV